MQLEGSLAVVTGAASGLGAATAQELARAGASVVLADLDGARVADVAGDLGEGAEGHALDVADAAAATLFWRELEGRRGPPSILVNCAGIAPAARIVGRQGPMALADFERVVRVNLLGSFNMLRLAADAMSRATPSASGERGVIINTASVAAFEGQIGQAAYAASKGGIVSLTLPAAREFAAQAIRVVAIAPGLFATPLLLTMPEAVQASLAATVPFPSRFGEPVEYASLVRHIIENPMLNGTVIRLDGALRMQPK